MTLDKKFIKKINRKNRKAELELYTNFFQFWMSVAMNYYNNEQDAALSINDSFIKICENIDSYNSKFSFATWSATILKRTIIDELRKNKKHKETMYSTENIELYEKGEEILIEEEIEESIALRALEKLPNATKKVIKLYMLEGYSHADISKELNITAQTSQWHVKTGKQKLKEILSDYKKG